MIKMFKNSENSEKIKALQRDVESLFGEVMYLKDALRFHDFKLKNPPKYKVGDKIKGGVICSVEIRKSSLGIHFLEYKALIGKEVKTVE